MIQEKFITLASRDANVRLRLKQCNYYHSGWLVICKQPNVFVNTSTFIIHQSIEVTTAACKSNMCWSVCRTRIQIPNKYCEVHLFNGNGSFFPSYYHIFKPMAMAHTWIYKRMQSYNILPFAESTMQTNIFHWTNHLHILNFSFMLCNYKLYN